jgi:pyruvate,water dikinase
VRTVLASREQAAEGTSALNGDEPLAVLVQPLLDSTAGGVLFGVDPVTGRTDHLVVAAFSEGPDAVVSGRVDGSRYVIDGDGGLIRAEHGAGGASLGRRQLPALARLVATTAEVFGGHQDVEWAFDRQGALILLQSRPVTTEVVGVPDGPVLGPGPVSETFPEPLSILEQGLMGTLCGKRCARRYAWPAPPPRHSWRHRRSWFASAAGSPSTSSHRGGPSPVATVAP